jgi:nicotinate-nucleotide pyrophosphorylase (carboxylating)
VDQPHKTTHIHHLITDGTTLGTGETIAVFQGPARSILRAERILLNYLSHLSGIASLTQSFVQKTESTKTQIVDTRKTLPGLRYLEKYAVQVGGGRNHRMNLSQLLMLKDNHIDRAGGITRAVHCLRDSYSPCPPIEVECRSEKDVREAVVCGVDHIMFDNMSCEEIKASLKFVPQSISTEISGGVTLDNLEKLAHLGADYISVGCLTHSAKAVDMSMTICDKKIPTV